MRASHKLKDFFPNHDRRQRAKCFLCGPETDTLTLRRSDSTREELESELPAARPAARPAPGRSRNPSAPGALRQRPWPSSPPPVASVTATVTETITEAGTVGRGRPWAVAGLPAAVKPAVACRLDRDRDQDRDREHDCDSDHG